MATSANTAFFPEAAELSISALGRGDQHVIAYRELGNATALNLHLSEAELVELHAKIGRHLHQLEEARRNARLARAARPPLHLYRLKYRPVAREHLPPGLLDWAWVERPHHVNLLHHLPKSNFTYGVIRLNRELSAAEMEHWEIAPVELQYLTPEARQRLIDDNLVSPEALIQPPEGGA